MRRPLRLSLQAPVLALWLALGPGGSWANDSFSSEFAHVVSGAAIAAGATAIADRYGAQDRRWVGFATSVGISAVMEGVQILTTGPEQVKHSALDFATNLVGAVFGAWVTDRYLLLPVVTRDAQGRHVLGAALSLSF